MAFQTLDLGIAADDGTGDSLRVGGDKINDNFLELYTALGDGDGVSSGISASATVITLVAPIIAEIDNSASITLDAGQDIVLDADGGDIFFKDAGATFGSATNSSGNLIIKSGTTTAATFSGANVTLAGTLGVGAITTTGAFKGADGYTIGNASVADVMTLASTGIVTFKDDIVLKDAATIGVASSTSAITIASTGIVTLVDDLILKDAATIGVTSSTSAISIASTGIVTFVDDILIKDAGTIGNASVAAVMTLASTGIVTFADDILIKDGGTIGNASVAAVMTLASSGIVTFADDILIKDGGTIGVASSTSAITIASSGIVTLVDDLLLKDACTIGTATTAGAISIAADGTVDLATAGATVNSAVIKTAGLETIFVPAAAMYPTTTGGCAALAQVEGTAGRPELKCLDFDPSSDENAQFTVAFPKSWNAGTVTFRAFFTVTGTNTGTVSWSLAGGSTVDNGVIDTAFGTAVAPTAKAHSGTSNDVDVTAVSGALTIANAADDAMTFFNIERDVSADDQSADARLLGIQIFFTTSAATDA